MQFNPCKHSNTKRFVDAAEYGSVVETDWEWCTICGAIRNVISNGEWELPILTSAVIAKAQFDMMRSAQGRAN